MNRLLLKTVFVSFLLLTALGAYLKIIHSELADDFLIIGLITSLVFLFCFISNVIKARHITPNEKFMWVVGFVFMGWLAGGLYLIKHHKVI